MPAVVLRQLSALLGIIALLLSGLPVSAAHAEPPDPPTAGLTVPLGDMGATTPLAFYGEQGTADLTFPVPRGLVPVTFNATVELPINVRGGLISVSQGDRTIARLPLPPADQAPVVIPLAGAAIVDNAVTVTLRTSLSAVEGYCLDPTTPLRLVNGAVTFAGTEAPPTAIADFLPPILRKLTIGIPASPDVAESDAAVRLAAAVVARYGRQPTSVVVVPLDAPPPAPAPFERQIVIVAGPDTGIVLQGGPNPLLRISGPDSELTNQTRLLSTDLSRLALGSRAVAGALKPSPQLPGDVTTLRALGQPGVSAVALSPQLAVGLDQTRMGRPAKSIRVHLIGSYTPLPASVSGRLAAIVGQETIASWTVDSAGLIDRWIDIPDHLLQRYTTLGISLNVAGNTGRCGEFQPLTLTIDGDSVVESAAAVPPVPDGLQSLPQALMPRTLIGIGQDAFADTARSAAIAIAMQRLSALPIDTEVTGIQQALDSRSPAIIVSANGWDHPKTALPVSADKNRIALEGVLANGASTTLTLDPELKYGALEAFYDGHRSLLVATSNGAPGQLDELLRWMSVDPRRWSRVDGMAVISAPGSEPVIVRAQSGVAGSAAAHGEQKSARMAAAAVVAAALLGTGLIYLTWRRRRAGG
ncbi:MAG: hypothetical protein ACOYEV_16090 [Candidatus Nanopelagicales bacterium]